MWNLSLDPMCLSGFDGYFKQVNPAWERTLEWTAEELTSRPWLDFVHADDRQATLNIAGQLIGGQLKIKLAITTSDQYGEGNDVKDFATIAGGAMPAASKPAAPAAGAKAAPPWAK